jgi:uncharacterized protein
MRAAVAAGCALLLLSGCSRLTAGAGSGSAVDCSRPSPAAIVACLSRSLSQFWTGETGRTLTVHAVLDPSPADVPRDCRGALQLHTAFTCPTDDRVYLTRPFVRRMLATGPAGQGWLRIASTLGHETGHVVQFAVHAPLLGKRHPSFADSRRIEQQADCLAGVWARAAGISSREFVAANRVVLGLVNTPRERRTHGTPAARLAALHRGLGASGPSACGLVVR